MNIYHWTTLRTAILALTTDGLPARRWAHFLEAQDRFARGTSWGLDPYRWKADHSICLVIDDEAVTNTKHHVAGHRTYLLTQGKVNPVFDSDCWKLESTEVDEVFIEGKIRGLAIALSKIILTPAIILEFSEVFAKIAEAAGVPVVEFSHIPLGSAMHRGP